MEADSVTGHATETWRATRLQRARTAVALGLGNAARVAAYRLARAAGLWRVITPMHATAVVGAVIPESESRRPPEISRPEADATAIEADEIVSGALRFYGHKPVSVGAPPVWLRSPYSPDVAHNASRHWSASGDGASDIKDIWEASRFSWAPVLARAWRLSGDDRYRRTLERWVLDWCTANPVNGGPNWECGQETSIRLLNLLLACQLIGPGEWTAGLGSFVKEHLERVAPTTMYARAQDNNHGTSEATALFVGGAWLLARGEAVGARYRDKGRRMLEERVARLFGEDGSFSQHSVNYHRLVLDTLSTAEWWRRRLDEAGFSAAMLQRARAATMWLYEMTDESFGDAPNVGANDGARLIGVTSAEYRDHRPSVQLAAALFCSARAYDCESADEPLLWLDVELPVERLARRQSRSFDDGGWVTLHAPSGASWACLRYPRYRFRPGHADALHLDLWCDGTNILRDGGSYGYAADEADQSYFPGTRSHNTIEFDGRDQMPRVSRFLFGAWLRAEEVTGVRQRGPGLEWAAGYTDARGAHHRREVYVDGDTWRITDRVSGDYHSAVLRWRLAPASYVLEGTTCTGPGLEIAVSGVDSTAMRLSEGWESRWYHVKSALPVLEVSIGPGESVVTTEIRFLRDGA